MFRSFFLLAAMVPGVSNVPAAPTIRNIAVEGNVRLPAAAILSQIFLRSRTPFNWETCRKDLKRIYDLGFFEGLQVQSRETHDGYVDLLFRVRECPFISSFSIEGVDSKLEQQIRKYLKNENLDLLPATPFKAAIGNKAAVATRNFLRERKYPNVKVKIYTEKRGNSVRVRFDVIQGSRLEIGSVRFIGNDSIPTGVLLKQMQVARPAHFWARWGGAARYIPEELEADLQRIRRYYMSHGFASVTIGQPLVQTTGIDSKQHIEVEIPVTEGPRYILTCVKMEGDIRAGRVALSSIIGSIPVPGDYDYSILESKRQSVVDALGHLGYALGRVELEQSRNESDRTVEALYRVTIGDPFAVGRIGFHGNNRLPDKFLRRELMIGEGEVFDAAKLDRSVERLNESNLLEKICRKDVALDLNDKTNALDITFTVREKDRQGVYGTGGMNGVNGGFLGILYTAFNLLHLGETISLQVDGGAAQSNMFLNIVGMRFFGSPFTVAVSVFNRYTGVNVANVVPGPNSLIRALRTQGKGMGLSGAYPIIGSLRLGSGLKIEQNTVKGSTSGNAATTSLGSEVAPFLLYDQTRGRGPETRGYQFSFSHGWNGSPFLKSLDSTSRAVQLTRYLDDPWTKGRNAFAFHIRGVRIRPHGGQPLFTERKLYPGMESIRGFGRGSLSPWMSTPGNDNLQPSGADTMFGFSTEYRVPIRGALSGAGFLDFGWTHIDPKNAGEIITCARLMDATNGVLRASLGGELRVQVPIIGQPARLIFSWNPLRLDRLLTDASSVLHSAEPKTSFRFALGALF